MIVYVVCDNDGNDGVYAAQTNEDRAKEIARLYCCGYIELEVDKEIDTSKFLWSVALREGGTPHTISHISLTQFAPSRTRSLAQG